jgi:hypothetical protein
VCSAEHCIKEENSIVVYPSLLTGTNINYCSPHQPFYVGSINFFARILSYTSISLNIVTWFTKSNRLYSKVTDKTRIPAVLRPDTSEYIPTTDARTIEFNHEPDHRTYTAGGISMHGRPGRTSLVSAQAGRGLCFGRVTARPRAARGRREATEEVPGEG